MEGDGDGLLVGCYSGCRDGLYVEAGVVLTDGTADSYQLDIGCCQCVIDCEQGADRSTTNSQLILVYPEVPTDAFTFAPFSGSDSLALSGDDESLLPWR